MITFSSNYQVYHFQYIFSSGWKHALGKTAFLPNRTCVGASLMHYIQVYIHPDFFRTRCQISWMYSSTRKRLRRGRETYRSGIYWLS